MSQCSVLLRFLIVPNFSIQFSPLLPYRYAIYRNGKLDEEVSDVTNHWPKDSVAFLIGCSFSYDGALMNAGIPLKSAQQGKNVPMYETSLKCRPAGSLSGNMVVSMKPIPSLQISKHVSTVVSSIRPRFSFSKRCAKAIQFYRFLLVVFRHRRILKTFNNYSSRICTSSFLFFNRLKSPLSTHMLMVDRLP